MHPWAYISFGLVAGLISAFFLGAVLFDGPTVAGAIVGVIVTFAAIVLLAIGLVAEGVRVGMNAARQRDSAYVQAVVPE